MKILFVYNHDRSFVHKDIKMLKKTMMLHRYFTKRKGKIESEVKKTILLYLDLHQSIQ